jgi:hypothetical protein
MDKGRRGRGDLADLILEPFSIVPQRQLSGSYRRRGSHCVIATAFSHDRRSGASLAA